MLFQGSEHPPCPGAVTGSWGGSSLLDTLPCFLWAFSARCVSHVFWTPMGAQKPPLSTREWVSPLPFSGHPKSLPALFLSSWPGVGRAAGQGSRGVGCTLPVGPRPPPADEIHGAEPLHPLRQVSAPQAEQAPLHPTMLEEEQQPLGRGAQRFSAGVAETEMQPRSTSSSPWGGEGGSNSCSRVNVGNQRCPLLIWGVWH